MLIVKVDLFLPFMSKEIDPMDKKPHVPLPKSTPAYFCANCGAIALDPKNICAVQGSGKKGDWCGIKCSKPPETCHTKDHVGRWQCRNCSQTAVNPELLCEPEKLILN